MADARSRDRFAVALTGSVLLHVLVLGLVLRSVPHRVTSVAVPFPVTLVQLDGGGRGGSAPAPEPVAEPVPAPPPLPVAPEPITRKPVPSKRQVVALHPRPSAASPPESVPAPPAEGAVGGGGPSGGPGTGGSPGTGGAGAGGDGSGGARPAYGTNPLPPYPLVARRLGKEGVVLLDVLVASDGHALDVRVVDSSGFAALDDSAVTTVLRRWRFIPASHDGVAVESRVTVPIRFRLSDVNG